MNSTNFWHIFDSGSKFKILKPNSSWLTFGISKFVSLSISCFLFLFSSTFFTSCCQTPTFWLLHLKITIILAITSKITIILAMTSRITIILAITPQNYYHFGYSISNLILYYCIKLNIDTNHHIGHFSCKS